MRIEGQREGLAVAKNRSETRPHASRPRLLRLGRLLPKWRPELIQVGGPARGNIAAQRPSQVAKESGIALLPSQSADGSRRPSDLKPWAGVGSRENEAASNYARQEVRFRVEGSPKKRRLRRTVALTVGNRGRLRIRRRRGLAVGSVLAHFDENAASPLDISPNHDINFHQRVLRWSMRRGSVELRGRKGSTGPGRGGLSPTRRSAVRRSFSEPDGTATRSACDGRGEAGNAVRPVIKGCLRLWRP